MQLMQLAKSLLNTNEFSASRYLDEIKTDKINSKDKLRDPTLKGNLAILAMHQNFKTRGC